MSSSDEETSQYEKLRLRNIANRKTLFSQISDEMYELKDQIITGRYENVASPAIPKRSKRIKQVPNEVGLAEKKLPRLRRTRQVTEDRNKEVSKDPSWDMTDAKSDLKTNRRHLRPKKVVSYAEEEILNADLYLFCDECGTAFPFGCSIHPPIFIPDEEAIKMVKVKPSGIRNGGRGVWNVSGKVIPVGVFFGPYRGKMIDVKDYRDGKESGYAWELHDSATKDRVVGYVDPGPNPDPEVDWLAMVNSANHLDDQNIVAVQYRGEIYYRVCNPIKQYQELLTYYGNEYARQMGIDPKQFRSERSPSDFRSKGKENETRCPFCCHQFFDAVAQRYHKCKQMLKASEAEATTSVCNCQCGARYNDRKEEHLHSAHNGDKTDESKGSSSISELSCNECCKKFHNPSLKTHQKFLAFESDKCGKKFGLKTDHQRHIQTVHQKILAFECDQCGKKFGLKHHLQRHIQTVHQKILAFDCDQCGQKFGQKSSLQIHIQTVHQKILAFECDQCGKKFGQSSQLYTHIRTLHQKS